MPSAAMRSRSARKLVEVIRKKENDSSYATAYKYILEEVAYTWFNRLIAIRFMEVNDYLPSRIRVLSSESGKIEPDLVTTPFDAELAFTHAEEETVLRLKTENKLDELFRLLFVKQCNALNEILPALFEKDQRLHRAAAEPLCGGSGRCRVPSDPRHPGTGFDITHR